MHIYLALETQIEEKSEVSLYISITNFINFTNSLFLEGKGTFPKL